MSDKIVLPTDKIEKIPFLEVLEALDLAIADCEDTIELGLQRDPPCYFNETAKQKLELLRAQNLIQRMSSLALCWQMWDRVGRP